MEHTETKPTDTQVPTNEEIDALLSLYLDADKNVDDAIEKRNVFGEQIEQLIKKHGFLPPRAKKSKRIQGDEYRATLSQSHGVDIDSTAVIRLLSELKVLGLARWFRKLFRREVIFVLQEDAQAAIEKLAAKLPGSNLLLLFAKTLKIENRSARLEVEPVKKEKAA